MDLFSEDSNAFFNRMSSNSSGTVGTSVKGTWPPTVPSTKGKPHDSSIGGSQGTPATHKRNLGSLITILRDLREGELDPMANREISYLTDYFLHTFECISMDMATEVNRLDLNERYSQELKAYHDVSVSHSYSFCPPLTLSFLSLFFLSHQLFF